MNRAGYASPVSGLEDFARLVDGDHGLCVVSTLRPDGTIQSSVVNAGVLPHPVTGAQVVGLVSRGDAHRVAYLRARPRVTVLVRAGWQWAAVEGPAELAGPDDPMPGVDAERLRLLLREIFTAAVSGSRDGARCSARASSAAVWPRAPHSAIRSALATLDGEKIMLAASPASVRYKSAPKAASAAAAARSAVAAGAVGSSRTVRSYPRTMKP